MPYTCEHCDQEQGHYYMQEGQCQFCGDWKNVRYFTKNKTEAKRDFTYERKLYDYFVKPNPLNFGRRPKSEEQRQSSENKTIIDYLCMLIDSGRIGTSDLKRLLETISRNI